MQMVEFTWKLITLTYLTLTLTPDLKSNLLKLLVVVSASICNQQRHANFLSWWSK